LKDLTQGPVRTHILHLSAFIAMSTTVQTLYFLADLYFVGRLGKEAIAGVALGGNLTMLVLALSQSLGVGATSLIAQAMGRKDVRRGEVLFNQALVMGLAVALAFGVTAFALRGAYCRALAADARTAELGIAYLDWFIPALCGQFPLVAMSAALRAVGNVKMPTAISVGTVVVNIALAPLLMFRGIAGPPLGVAGAALASFLAIVVGCVALVLYSGRAEAVLRFRSGDWRPQPRTWWEMLRVGLPAGGEFALIFVYMLLVYDILRPFGAAAQAGFGIGVRCMQALFLPAVAIAFATAPVAGQNYGARLGDRVRGAFSSAAAITAAVMLVVTVLCHIAPDVMVGAFNRDPQVVRYGAEYLRIISWTFVASGVVFVSSSVFQGMGNTVPPLASSVLRLVLFAVPAYALARRPGFEMRHVWYVALAATGIQTVLSLWLLRREFARKLGFPPVAPGAARGAVETA
jgi:putative MATE family efflux protein